MSASPGRVAVITGGARGISRVTAVRLAAAGLRIGVLDRDPADETVERVRAVGGTADYVVADIADVDAYRTALTELTERTGPADVLVYGAGITNHIAPLARMTLDGWQRELTVNLTGAFLAVQHVMGHMVEQHWGRIVFISSGAARGGLSRQAGYSASKAGLLGLSQTVAIELGRHGITSNCILPGLIATEMVQAMPEEITTAAVSRTPIGRTGTMDEVASLIAYLVSDDAAFITGDEILIDGGGHLNAITLGSRKAVARGST